MLLLLLFVVSSFPRDAVARDLVSGICSLAHSVPANIEEPASHLLRCRQCPGVAEVVRFPLFVLIAGTQQCDANKGDLMKVLTNWFWTDGAQRMGT